MNDTFDTHSRRPSPWRAVSLVLSILATQLAGAPQASAQSTTWVNASSLEGNPGQKFWQTVCGTVDGSAAPTASYSCTFGGATATGSASYSGAGTHVASTITAAAGSSNLGTLQQAYGVDQFHLSRLASGNDAATIDVGFRFTGGYRVSMSTYKAPAFIQWDDEAIVAVATRFGRQSLTLAYAGNNLIGLEWPGTPQGSWDGIYHITSPFSTSGSLSTTAQIGPFSNGESADADWAFWSAIGTGQFDISVASMRIYDATGSDLTSDFSVQFDHGTQLADDTVGTPEPSAALLLGTGCTLLIALRPRINGERR